MRHFDNSNKPAFSDFYEKGFLIGACLCMASLAFGILYAIFGIKTGPVDNTFCSFIGLALVNILLTPIIIAAGLFLKSRITQKFTFKNL